MPRARSSRVYSAKPDAMRDKVEFLVTPDLKRRLSEAAIDADITLSEFVRSLVVAGMEAR